MWGAQHNQETDALLQLCFMQDYISLRTQLSALGTGVIG